MRSPARLVVALGLAATTHLALAGSFVLALDALDEGVAHAAEKAGAPQKLIDSAKKAFEEAQYDESLQLLSAALLKLDVTDDQRVEVYRLLAYNYILLKKEDAAKSAAYKLYALDEDFTLPKGESPRFREPFSRWKQAWIDDGRPGQKKAEEKPAAPVVVKHSPPDQVPHDQSVAITGDVTDPDHRVAKVTLFYRSGSSGKFTELDAKLALGGFQANIPGTAITPPLVEYYVQAFDSSGLPLAGRGDAEAPLRVIVEGEKEGSIFSTWWFWTGTTAVVAGGVLGFLLLSKKSSTGPGGPNGGPTSSNVTISLGE